MTKIVLRLSSAARWSGCRASVALSAMLPDPPSSPAALEGTSCHALGELLLRNGEVDASGYVGLTPESPKGETLPAWDLDMARGAELYAETVFSVYDAAAGDELYVEKQVVAYENDRVIVQGTSDCFVWKHDARELHVFDLKYGFGEVQPKGNPQAYGYALGASKFLGVDIAKLKDVVVWIVQPRAGGVKRHDTESLEIMRFREGLKETADAIAFGNDNPYNPGAHCTYCPGNYHGRCEAIREAALSAFGDIPTAAAGPPPEMSDAALATQLSRMAVVKAYADALDALAERRMLAGRIPPGFKAVRKRSNRDWKFPAAEVVSIVELMTGHNIAAPAEPMSPAQAEKKLGKKAFATVAEFVVKKPGAPKLVPETDSGEALTPAELTGTQGFSDIPDPS